MYYEMYYKNVTIVNDTPRVVRMMIISDAPSCGITYNCHSDDSRGIIFHIDATYEMRTTEYGEICISIDNQTSAEKAF
jgi:hypothetical protein